MASPLFPLRNHVGRLLGLACLAAGNARAVPPTAITGLPTEVTGLFPVTEQDVSPLERIVILGHRPVAFDYTVPSAGAVEVHLAAPLPALTTFENEPGGPPGLGPKDATQSINPPYARVASQRMPWYLAEYNFGREVAQPGDVLHFAVAVPHAVWTNTLERGFAFQITPLGAGISTNFPETLAASGLPAELVVNAPVAARAGTWTASAAGHVEARALMLGGATVTLRRPGGQVAGVLRGDMNWARLPVSAGEVLSAEAAVPSGRGRAWVSFRACGAPPANATPETAQPLAGANVTVNAGNNANAPASGRGLPSRWFAWTAPETAIYLFSAEESSVPATIQVYRDATRVADSGSVVTNVFSPVWLNQPTDLPYLPILGNGHTAGSERVAVGLEGGVSYRIAVGSAPGVSGDLRLKIVKHEPVETFIDYEGPLGPNSFAVGFTSLAGWFYRGWYSFDLVRWQPILSDSHPDQAALFYSTVGYGALPVPFNSIMHVVPGDQPITRIYYKFEPFHDGFSPKYLDHNLDPPPQ